LRCEEILELHGLALPMVCSKYLPILFSKDQETVRGFNRLPVQTMVVGFGADVMMMKI
jgi:hypothetical protein